MKKIEYPYYVVHVTTESCDHYLYLYDYEPTRREIAKLLVKKEGSDESYKYYEDCCSIEIEGMHPTSKKAKK
jgi:hypothetical protein